MLNSVRAVRFGLVLGWFVGLVIVWVGLVSCGSVWFGPVLVSLGLVRFGLVLGWFG